MHTQWSRQEEETPARFPASPGDVSKRWARRRRPNHAERYPTATVSETPQRPKIISFVTDREAWANALIEVASSAGLIAQRSHWSAVRQLSEPGDALVVDVVDVNDDILEALRLWASQAWQPICVVSLEAAPDAGRFASDLRERAFDRIVSAHRGSAYIGKVLAALRLVLASDAWIASRTAQSLECFDPLVVRILAAGIDMLPQHHTVTRWAGNVGFARRQELEAIFAAHALPSPKAVLERMRLARLVHLADASNPPLSRAELATLFGYSSGDYLGKRAKAQTGVPLGELITHGANAVLGIRY